MQAHCHFYLGSSGCAHSMLSTAFMTAVFWYGYILYVCIKYLRQDILHVCMQRAQVTITTSHSARHGRRLVMETRGGLWMCCLQQTTLCTQSVWYQSATCPSLKCEYMSIYIIKYKVCQTCMGSLNSHAVLVMDCLYMVFHDLAMTSQCIK